jgi:hypothetical protein
MDELAVIFKTLYARILSDHKTRRPEWIPWKTTMPTGLKTNRTTFTTGDLAGRAGLRRRCVRAVRGLGKRLKRMLNALDEFFISGRTAVSRISGLRYRFEWAGTPNLSPFQLPDMCCSTKPFCTSHSFFDRSILLQYDRRHDQRRCNGTTIPRGSLLPLLDPLLLRAAGSCWL